jgi:hypothetical protein
VGVGDQPDEVLAVADPAVERLVARVEPVGDGGHGQVLDADVEGGGDDLVPAEAGRSADGAGHAVTVGTRINCKSQIMS